VPDFPGIRLAADRGNLQGVSYRASLVGPVAGPESRSKMMFRHLASGTSGVIILQANITGLDVASAMSHFLSIFVTASVLSIFVIVLVPAVSLTAKVTLSPACRAFSRAPSWTLNSSVAAPAFAPVVPSGISLTEMVPLIRSILVTIPVRVCWASADVPAMLRAALAAIIKPANFMEYSRLYGFCDKPGLRQ
jgi:hypothetical protein